MESQNTDELKSDITNIRAFNYKVDKLITFYEVKFI